MLNCWRVNECWIVDITEFLIQKLSDVSATNISLELGGYECHNLNFMNFKIDNLKIRKNSCNFKIRKIRILGVWCVRNLLYASDYCRVNYVICVLLQRHRTILHLCCVLRQFWYVTSTTPFKVVCSYIMTSKLLQSNKRCYKAYIMQLQFCNTCVYTWERRWWLKTSTNECTLLLLPAGCREAATCRYCFYSVAKNQHFAP